MKWASALATTPELDDAVDDVTDAIGEALGGAGPDLIVVFASTHFGSDLSRLPARLLERFPTSRLIGCSGGGIIGDGREVEGRPALSVTGAVLPDIALSTFHLAPDPAGWPRALDIDRHAEPDFLLLPDPFTCDSQRLIRWLDIEYARGTKIGGIASGAREPGGNLLFVDDRTHLSGAVGLALSGDLEIDTVVAQGCRPIGNPLFVTSCKKNVILELDGQPAVEVVQDLYESLPPRDQELFRHSLFLGVVMQDAKESYRHGDFLVRNLAGIDPHRGALLIGAMLRDNQVVQFHLRDAETSADDLRELLARHRAEAGVDAPTGALLFSCLGRGVHLYGKPDHDSAMFREFFGAVPLGGFFCNGEIGPVQGRTFLHGYTSSFGLFRRRQRLA
jgi:small ligand-binding sensory domain FIST